VLAPLDEQSGSAGGKAAALSRLVGEEVPRVGTPQVKSIEHNVPRLGAPQLTLAQGDDEDAALLGGRVGEAKRPYAAGILAGDYRKLALRSGNAADAHRLRRGPHGRNENLFAIGLGPPVNEDAIAGAEGAPRNISQAL
jgi:hypothetical protein